MARKHISFDMVFKMRCMEASLNQFIDWCEKVGKKHPSFLREVMAAAVEGRLTIKPKKEIKELYNG